MEDSAAHVLDSVLRCLNWDEDFAGFFRLKCGLFRAFSISLEEFDCGLTAVHLEFLELLEATLKKHITPMMHDPLMDDIMLSSAIGRLLDGSCSTRGEGGGRDKPVQRAAAESIIRQLDSYMDFECFGNMMRDKCLELYPTPVPGGGEPAAAAAAAAAAGAAAAAAAAAAAPSSFAAPATTTESSFAEKRATEGTESTYIAAAKPPAPTRITAVRVLWDIENVGVRREVGALQTVSRLFAFLERRGLYGPAVDCRVTAFFRPTDAHGNPTNISQQVIDDLDRAAVELVWVSSKREDADRKLTTRVSQEMAVLTPADTAFVVISSDQDFRTQYQMMNNAGFRVLVLHNATTPKWTEALTLYASEAYLFDKDVLQHQGRSRSNSVEGGGGGGTDDGHSYRPAAPGQPDTGPSPRKAKYSGGSGGGGGGRGGSGGRPLERFVVSPADLALLPSGVVWCAAVCIQWRGTFGFLKTDVGQTFISTSDGGASASASADNVTATATPAAGGKSVKMFIHKTTLKGRPRAELMQGEKLLVQVDMEDSKGPKATAAFFFAQTSQPVSYAAAAVAAAATTVPLPKVLPKI